MGPTRPGIRAAVRPAVADDLDELVRLDVLAREHLNPHRGGPVYLLRTARPQPPDASFLDDLVDPDRHVVVGCLGTAVVGYAMAVVAELRDGTHIAEVGEIFVEPEARDVGVGNLLMTDLVEWATTRACVGIDAHALPGDRNTKNFFESFGLVARAITVHRDLPRAVSQPQLLVGAICCSGDEVTLVRTGHGPAAGEWGVPSGPVRPGELLAEAVVRVVADQAAQDTLCGPFIGWDEVTGDGLHHIVMYFEAVMLGPSDTAPTTAEQRSVPSWDVCELRLVDGLAEFLAEHDIIDTVV